jgi:NADPH-dependent glutamate synthase beta subunit-like oxidoreductase
MKLSFGLKFEDLYSREGLEKLHAEFLKTAPSQDLLEQAKQVEDFIAELFNIRAEVAALKAKHDALAPIFAAKKLFVQRQMQKYLQKSVVSDSCLAGLSEVEISVEILKAMDVGDEDVLIAAAHFLQANALRFPTLTRLPQKLDFGNLVHNAQHGCMGTNPSKAKASASARRESQAAHELIKRRSSFSLTDDGGSLEYALDQANYCIYCHERGKDSCSKGLWDNEKPKISPTSTQLAGCPLDEKISEMNMLKAQGFSIAALAVVTLDNPMCAATGHRICNDCMKSCIYQKQEPVDIPQIESKNLRDVLGLPWGFEIYSLLTRWNPLRAENSAENPIPKASTGKKVLVVGLGPAGFTLAHYLLNEGHEVLAIDGLKIEPLGIAFKPVKDIQTIWQDLNARQPQGFGGVTEYGITVRWDKNFLTIIRLLLERRANFALKGGVRFGSNITFDQAYEMGFDHVAMCAGAGKPTILDMKNGLARGVRTASDFLMSLQSGGAFLADSIANLQIRAPIIVIGGGLTAVDTATEAQVYYRVQCLKFKKRWDKFGERLKLTEEEKVIAAELLEPNDSTQLSTVVYRRSLQDSPAYRLNHEEVEKAFEEGIGFVENATPLEVLLDEFGAAKALRVLVDGEEKIIPARTILIAAGTQPNTILAQEDERFALDGKYFQMLDENGKLAKPTGHCKPKQAHVLMHKDEQGRTMSFFGDLHPDFAGNVVKAMASAKRGYAVISELLTSKLQI